MTKEEYEKQKKSLEDDMKEVSTQYQCYQLARIQYQSLVLKSTKNVDTELRDFIDRKIRVSTQRHNALKELLIKLHEEYIASLERGEA